MCDFFQNVRFTRTHCIRKTPPCRAICTIFGFIRKLIKSYLFQKCVFFLFLGRALFKRLSFGNFRLLNSRIFFKTNLPIVMSNSMVPSEVIMLDVPAGMQINLFSTVGPLTAAGPCSVPFSIPKNIIPKIEAPPNYDVISFRTQKNQFGENLRTFTIIPRTISIYPQMIPENQFPGKKKSNFSEKKTDSL